MPAGAALPFRSEVTGCIRPDALREVPAPETTPQARPPPIALAANAASAAGGARAQTLRSHVPALQVGGRSSPCPTWIRGAGGHARLPDTYATSGRPAARPRPSRLRDEHGGKLITCTAARRRSVCHDKALHHSQWQAPAAEPKTAPRTPPAEQQPADLHSGPSQLVALPAPSPPPSLPRGAGRRPGPEATLRRRSGLPWLSRLLLALCARCRPSSLPRCSGHVRVLRPSARMPPAPSSSAGCTASETRGLGRRRCGRGRSFANLMGTRPVFPAAKGGSAPRRAAAATPAPLACSPSSPRLRSHLCGATAFGRRRRSRYATRCSTPWCSRPQTLGPATPLARARSPSSRRRHLHLRGGPSLGRPRRPPRATRCLTPGCSRPRALGTAAPRACVSSPCRGAHSPGVRQSLARCAARSPGCASRRALPLPGRDARAPGAWRPLAAAPVRDGSCGGTGG
jgi:hypothetical protein